MKRITLTAVALLAAAPAFAQNAAAPAPGTADAAQSGMTANTTATSQTNMNQSGQTATPSPNTTGVNGPVTTAPLPPANQTTAMNTTEDLNANAGATTPSPAAIPGQTAAEQTNANQAAMNNALNSNQANPAPLTPNGAAP